MTPKQWTVGSIKTHMGVALNRLSTDRRWLLEATHTKADVAELPEPQEFSDRLTRLGDTIRAEAEWLGTLNDVPAGLTKSERTRYLADYSHQIVAAAESLRGAVRPPYTVEKFEALGLALLTLMTTASDTSRVR